MNNLNITTVYLIFEFENYVNKVVILQI